MSQDTTAAEKLRELAAWYEEQGSTFGNIPDALRSAAASIEEPAAESTPEATPPAGSTQ